MKKINKKESLELVIKTRPRCVLPSQVREDKRAKRLKKAERRDGFDF